MLPLSHDEVVHGKGSLLRQDAGRRVAAVRRAAGAARLHVGAPGQAAAVHGVGVRPGQRVVGASAAWTGGCSSTASHAGVQRLVARPQPRSTAARPALWSQDTSPDGFSWIDANDADGNVLSFLRLAARRSTARAAAGRWRSPAWPTSPAMPHFELPGRPAAGRPLARGAQHRRGRLRRQRRGQPGDDRGHRGAPHGQPASAVITLPPLAVLMLAPAG